MNIFLVKVRMKAWMDASAIVKVLKEKLEKPGKGKPARED